MPPVIHALSVAIPIVLILFLALGIMMHIGRSLLPNNTIPGTRVSADGAPKYKPGGITIDWTTIAAAGGDVNLPEGSGAVVKAGQKYLRFGQIMTKITASGQFGPYDSAAADGRQLLARGDCFILDETITEYTGGIVQLTAHNDQVGGVFDAGRVFIDRVLQSGVSAHSLALGPTLVEFLAAFPAIAIARD